MFKNRLRWREMLPIVSRELRVASQRRNTWRLRILVALIGAFQLILAAIFLSGFSVYFGLTLFWLTSFLGTILCAGAGLALTSDCISREKREGTLGLLFLTRLTSLDIILGKFAAGLLTGGSVAFAAFPFLAFSLCLGGVTAGEFWMMSAFLLLLLLFSLVVGIFVSTLFRSESAVALAFSFLMFIPTAAIPLAIIKWQTVPLALARWNPLFPILSVLDSGAYFPREHIASALLFQAALAIGMMGFSCLILPWLIRAQPLRTPTPQFSIGIKLRSASRRAILESNPLLWLSARQNHPLILLYIFVALRFVIGFFTTVPLEAEVLYVILLAVLPKVFVLWQASGMIAEERRSGFLETLLTTPMSANEILKGKIRAIQRQIYPALLFALAVQWAISTEWWAAEKEIPVRTTIVLAVMITVIIDVHTAAWIGLWQGLIARDRRRALIRSLSWGILAPWVLPTVFFVTIVFLFDPRWMKDSVTTVPPTLIAANVASVALACFAMARVHDKFRSTATQTWSLRANA